MNYVYPLKRISLFFSFVIVGFVGNLNAQSTCGSTIEDFNSVPVAEAGFTSNVQGSTIAGFAFSVSGNNGYLQRCNTTADVIYQIHTPTYQTAVSQTSIGFGFDLSGAVQSTEVIVFIEYTNSSTGNTSVSYIKHHYPCLFRTRKQRNCNGLYQLSHQLYFWIYCWHQIQVVFPGKSRIQLKRQPVYVI
jgi:hypothetical protein